ncbi:unnamed protein product [Tilletia caries]|nr:hypothetical protein CF328_g4586 [Tilletia controversa]CAD6885583.1 unnamed protein product [Tilletia caries]
MLSIQQSHFQSFSLLKAALQVADASPNSSSSNRSPADRPIVVVCVPIFRAPTLVQPPSPARALPLPPPGPSSDIVQPTCILFVTGLQRVRIDPWFSIKVPPTNSAL